MRFSRRTFLAGTLSLTLMPSVHSETDIPAIIIGSGFGGAVAALRLAQAGIPNLVLERGRRWPITPNFDTFCTYAQPDGRAAWLSSSTVVYNKVAIPRYTGILDRVVGNGIGVYRGVGVGGGSLVYNAVTYQPGRNLFYRSFPASVDYDEMDQIYYPRVRSILNPSPIPEDILATSYYQQTRCFREMANAAGLPNRLLDINLNWDVVREEINGTKPPSAITGEVWYGMNSGAKNSLDRNYLAQSAATGFTQVLPLHEVTQLEELSGGGGYRVYCDQINEAGEMINQLSFTCRHLFLAAGSIGTSSLLVKARAKGQLPRLSLEVGNSWGTNGDTSTFQSGLSGLTNARQGGPASAIVEHFDNPQGPVVLENFPSYQIKEGTLYYLGMGFVNPKGKLSYEASTDSVKLTWPTAENRTLLQATKATCTQLKGNSVGTTVGANTTGHPLGGAVMEKVCDTYGQVFNYPGLYVVDSALIPGSTGCANPSFTIAALAERAMERFLLTLR